jgi:hypothetical protein
MKISHNGNIGIGTTIPKQKLHLQDGTLLINSTGTNMTTINIPTGEGQPIVFLGNATFWDDFAVAGLQLEGGVFAPTLTVVNNSATYCFAGTVRNEYAYGATELSHGWKEGSVLYPHIHIQKETNTVGNITFNLAWNIADHTHRISGQTNITVNVTTFPIIRGFNQYINATTFNLGSTWSFKLTRLQDATTDDYTGLACIWQVSSHYESDTLGSASEYGKWA